MLLNVTLGIKHELFPEPASYVCSTFFRSDVKVFHNKRHDKDIK